MPLFGKSQQQNLDADTSPTGYVPPDIDGDRTPSSSLNYDTKTIQKQDSPEISEGDDGMMIISTSKSREEDNHSKSGLNMTDVSKITKSGRDIGKATVANVRKVAEDGPLSFRVLAFLGGAIMMVTSVLSVLSDVFTFSIMSSLISLYTFILGLFIIVLEGKMFMPIRSVGAYQQQLFSMAKFLQYVWGRGMLYIFAGTLQLSQMNFLNIISGVYICFVGIISLLVGHSTSSKLIQLRTSITDEAVLQQKFKEHDKDEDNALNLLEFQSFITDLGLEMDHNELVAAFNEIDFSDTGKVSLNDFTGWWCEKGSNESVDLKSIV